jgi:hypothetical protein
MNELPVTRQARYSSLVVRPSPSKSMLLNEPDPPSLGSSAFGNGRLPGYGTALTLRSFAA